MDTRMGQLRLKEVISIGDGSRFGYVGDIDLDLESGQVNALIVPGRLRLFGLLGREEDVIIPWEAVRRFGEDTILVDAVTHKGSDGGKHRGRQEKSLGNF